MQAKFHQQLEGSDEHVSFPFDWDLTLLQECDRAVGILVEAYHNTCLYHHYVLHMWVISNEPFLRHDKLEGRGLCEGSQIKQWVRMEKLKQKISSNRSTRMLPHEAIYCRG